VAASAPASSGASLLFRPRGDGSGAEPVLDPEVTPRAARRDSPAADGADDFVVDAYHEHFDYLWGLLGRLGVPRPQLEDAVQEIFLVLHRRRDEFRGDASVRTWLHGIAVHVARRQRDRARRHAAPPLGVLVPVAPTSPEAEASARQALARLDRILAGLSDEQREVFVLAEVAELAAPEIAELLAVNLNTVYSRLRLARAHVRAALDRSGGGG
jgi:RNA polymerase sigma-70 factor (ECF subfamily)